MGSFVFLDQNRDHRAEFEDHRAEDPQHAYRDYRWLAPGLAILDAYNVTVTISGRKYTRSVRTTSTAANRNVHVVGAYSPFLEVQCNNNMYNLYFIFLFYRASNARLLNLETTNMPEFVCIVQRQRSLNCRSLRYVFGLPVHPALRVPSRLCVLHIYNTEKWTRRLKVLKLCLSRLHTRIIMASHIRKFAKGTVCLLHN